MKLISHSLSKGTRWPHSLIKTNFIEQPSENIVDENALDKMARDGHQAWVIDGAFAMFTTILTQSEYHN